MTTPPRKPIKGVIKTVGQPHDRLTTLCDKMTTALDAALRDGEDVKCIIMLQNDEKGGIVMHGYEDTNDGYTSAMTDLFLHLRAIFRANGQELSFAALGQDPPEELMFGTDGTWLCHVCGMERPDRAISVRRFDAMAPMMSIKFNVRYCNDNGACFEGAQAVAIKWNSGQPVSEI